MILAADLHTQERFDAIEGFDPSRSVLSEYFHMLGSLLRVLIRSAGAPRDLYESAALLKKEWRDLARNIAALEAIVRRLLLMLAAKDERPLVLPKPRPVKRRATPALENAAPACKPFLPEALAGRFIVVPPPPRIARKLYPRRKPDPNQILVSAHGLAARLEALIRIYADPLAAAMRLRRRFARHDLKHQLCVRMMAEPARLLPDYPHYHAALHAIEADTLAANAKLAAKPPD